MSGPQTTRATLLVRLRGNSDPKAWADFVDLYSPVIYRFGRRHGLQDADAADLVQEVLRSVARSLTSYDQEKARFRSWLMAIVRHRLYDYWNRRTQVEAGSGDTAVFERLGQIACEDNAEKSWEQEYRWSLFRLAASQVRESFQDSTWQAFWMTYVDGQTTRSVADALGISEGAVYIAKSRVLARLRSQVQALED